MIELKKHSYESLIQQLIFLEENSRDIEQTLVNGNIFPSGQEVQRFLKKYAKKVESVFAHVQIVNGTDDFSSFNKNLFPFIVIGSCFTLRNSSNHNFYCRLTSDIYENASGISHNIYAFSRSGLSLLLKEKDEYCTVDLGGGMNEYVINSIRLS